MTRPSLLPRDAGHPYLASMPENHRSHVLQNSEDPLGVASSSTLRQHSRGGTSARRTANVRGSQARRTPEPLARGERHILPPDNSEPSNLVTALGDPQLSESPHNPPPDQESPDEVATQASQPSGALSSIISFAKNMTAFASGSNSSGNGLGDGTELQLNETGTDPEDLPILSERGTFPLTSFSSPGNPLSPPLESSQEPDSFISSEMDLDLAAISNSREVQVSREPEVSAVEIPESHAGGTDQDEQRVSRDVNVLSQQTSNVNGSLMPIDPSRSSPPDKPSTQGGIITQDGQKGAPCQPHDNRSQFYHAPQARSAEPPSSTDSTLDQTEMAVDPTGSTNSTSVAGLQPSLTAARSPLCISSGLGGNGGETIVPMVNDSLLPGGSFWASTLRMIDRTVFDAAGRSISGSGTTDLRTITSELALTVRDSIALALEEHHRGTRRPYLSRDSCEPDHGKRKRPPVAGTFKEKQADDDMEDFDAGNSTEDEAEDDEVDFNRPCKPYSRKSRRKRVVRSSKSRVCHRLLREYLDGKGLRKGGMPDPPSAEELGEFQKTGKPGPSMTHPKFDWLSRFSSPWNSLMIYKLAMDFTDSILSSVPHEPKWKELDHIKLLITRKLNSTRRNYLSSLPPPPHSSITLEQKKDENQKRHQEDRKASRRHSRRKGTFLRRAKIIEERKHEDTALWSQVKEILETLSEAGMSSDETETEARGIISKTVRRIPKPWLNDELGQMWEGVEMAGRSRVKLAGNCQLRRLYAASMTSSRPRAIRGLPKNFYSSLWWKGLTEDQQHRTDPSHDEMPIPSKDMFNKWAS